MCAEQHRHVCGTHTQSKSCVLGVAVCPLSPLRDASLCKFSLGSKPLCFWQAFGWFSAWAAGECVLHGG